MKVSRQAALWTGTAVTALVLLVLLRHVLLPFGVGLALAYLLAPVVSTLERFGINRTCAALTIVLLLVSTLAASLFLTLPLLAGEVTGFVESFPSYVARLQALVAEANRAWLGRILGHELTDEPSAAQIVMVSGGQWLEDI